MTNQPSNLMNLGAWGSKTAGTWTFRKAIDPEEKPGRIIDRAPLVLFHHLLPRIFCCFHSPYHCRCDDGAEDSALSHHSCLNDVIQSASVTNQFQQVNMRENHSCNRCYPTAVRIQLPLPRPLPHPPLFSLARRLNVNPIKN